jgi:Uma2 family endonuclease
MSLAESHPQNRELFRITIEQYHAMIEAGILTTEDKAELLEGVLVTRMSKNPSHVRAARRVAAALEAMMPAGFFAWRQDPITIGDSEPEPDFAIIRGVEDDFARALPTGNDVALVVECSDTTLRLDRTLKLRVYARAGIPVYWIVNLLDRTIEVHSDPDPQATDPTYRSKKVYSGDDVVPVVIDSRDVGQVPISSILP